MAIGQGFGVDAGGVIEVQVPACEGVLPSQGGLPNAWMGFLGDGHNVEVMSTETVNTPHVTLSFTASAALRDSFQRVLVNLIALELVGKQAHWNIVGPNFRDLHLNLDEVVGIARTGSDDVAERMRAVNATPDGRPATVAASATVPVAPEGEVLTTDAVAYIVSAIEAVVATLRDVHDTIDGEDPSSSGIIEDLTVRLEQQAWFLSAEVRKPVR